MKMILFSIVMMFGLTACVPDALVRHDVIEKKTMVLVELDEALMEPCHLSDPPLTDVYMKINRDGKEALMTKYISELIVDNKRCSLDKVTLKNMLAKQKATIHQFNLDEENRVKQIVEKKTE